MPTQTDWSPPFEPPETGCRPAGYAWLVDKYRLDTLPHWRWTFVADRHVHKEFDRRGSRLHVLPPPRAPEHTDLAHLLFALRYDGVSLPICRALFEAADLDALGSAILEENRRTPTGAYARRAWYLFETLTGRELPLSKVEQGNYVPLLDPEVHVTGPIRKHRRQRIDVNLLGSPDFAPMLRWTDRLREVSGEAIHDHIHEVIARYDDRTLQRALSFLYTRETLASFEIENERPPASRAERFVALLEEAPELSELDEATLVRLQKALVDSRFADDGWRTTQVYVGESLDLAHQRIHYVCPKPEDVPELMDGHLAATRLLMDSGVDPALAAAVISFAFVLVHPFNDGNGRIHRWLLHWVLSRRGVTPDGLVIPVSAVMLSHRREYDEVLETFSDPILERASYDLDDAGAMTVHGSTVDWYRHPDLTPMAEGLWRWLQLAVDEELPSEIGFLLGFDRARSAIQEVVDMPDRLIDLFIKVCRQNAGELSNRKRESHFSMLTDDEVTRMEAAVREHMSVNE